MSVAVVVLDNHVPRLDAAAASGQLAIDSGEFEARMAHDEAPERRAITDGIQMPGHTANDHAIGGEHIDGAHAEQQTRRERAKGDADVVHDVVAEHLQIGAAAAADVGGGASVEAEVFFAQRDDGGLDDSGDLFGLVGLGWLRLGGDGDGTDLRPCLAVVGAAIDPCGP